MPLFTARLGSVRVTVTRGGHGTYCVAWRAFAKAPRKRETFRIKARAIERAHEIARALANGLAGMADYTANDRETLAHIRTVLAPLGLPPAAAIEEFAAARLAVAPHTLTEAAAYFTQHHRPATGCPATGAIVAAVLDDLTNRRKQPCTAGYLRTITPRLHALAAAFPDLRTATTDALLAYFLALRHRGRPISDKTFNHHRGTFALLWRWATLRGHVTGAGPLAGIKALDAPGACEVYAPGEMRAILSACPREWLPFVVLSGFAGLRVCEVAAVAWTDLVWEQGEISISRAVAGKGGKRRNVPMSEPLRAWLAPWRTALGPVYGIPDDQQLAQRMETLHRQLERRIPGFRWKPNALRHSFASYHVGLHRNRELTRTIMGTSTTMLDDHYDDPQFRTAAETWFAILPDQAGGILQIA